MKTLYNMKKLYNTFILAFCIIAAGCSCAKATDDNGQTDKKPYVKIDVNQKYVSNKAGTFSVTVTSNTDWTAESQADWISVKPTAGSGNANVTITYESNYTDPEGTVDGEERSGSVRFSADGIIPARVTVSQGARTFKNPVFMPMPDPYIYRYDNGTSVKYYPCKSNGNGVNLGETDKLTDWGGTTEVWHLPATSSAWNRANLWAPELHRVDGKWYIYYAAGWTSSESQAQGYGDYGTQRTGVLECTSDNPYTGTWIDKGMIFTGDADDLEKYKENGNVATTLDNDYAIDMTVFELNDQLYAVWSGNDDQGKQRLYIAPMVNPYTIETARIQLAYPQYSWELETSDLLEGPAMLFNPDRTKLFCVYSCCQSTTKAYKLGMLELDLTNPATSDPLIPANWKKSMNPVFTRCDNYSISNNPYADDSKNELGMKYGGVNGVGHNTFTKSPDGTEDWIVYHTKRYSESGWGNRDAFIQMFTWDEDGRPVFGTPVGWQEEIAVPSGEPL